MKHIRDHFQKVDVILFAALEQTGGLEEISSRHTDYFVALCDEIVSQQLSGKVATVIFERFRKLFPKGNITAKAVLKLTHEQLRAVGMSNAKAKYIKDLAEKVVNQEISLDALVIMENEQVIEELTKIKGIGRWTAEMFLMFTLKRKDIFSHGDLGLKNAIKKLYLLENPTKEQIEIITIKWSPYRTYACRILWNSLDNAPKL
ncbi:MAG: DNA-3-methyladenine glycosylase 2 family protein [Candidatus Levybacteria bacterium]|nr:DNA-3-methyladenine glycosylase 2 family protein [Candidatus Levybacteria bacterium]